MTFIAAIAVSLDPTTTAPIAVSVVTSYLVVSFIRFAITRRRETDAEPGDTSAAVTS
jgi:hypothetical protein